MSATSFDYSMLEPEEVDETNALYEPEEPDADSVQPDYDEPSRDFIRKQRRAPGAIEYEKKTKRFLAGIMRVAVSDPRTVPDGAALIMYAPAINRASGDLAAVSPNWARCVDFVASGSDSPAFVLISAVIPLALQLVRDHEPEIEQPIAQVGIRIPFTKRRLKLPLGMRLGKKLRNLTLDPDSLSKWVFENHGVSEELQKQGIRVAYSSNGKRH